MAKKSLGYVRLEWTCPNCGTRNPGPEKTCVSCGGPQPEEVQFEQAAQEELIKDEAELERASVGPDIHCFYCGTRNPADAETCSQCGGDLTQGTARASGQVLGAHRTGPVEKINCPACDTPNDPSAPKCVQCGASLAPARQPKPAPVSLTSKGTESLEKKKSGGLGWGLIAGIIVVVMLCAAAIAFVVLSRQTEDIRGTVQDTAWTRTIAIEGLVPVEYEDWEADIPAEAVVGTCVDKIHHTQDEPAPGAQEVCGTPYTVDEGSGYGEVVQDCQYQVYAAWCEYTVDEWQAVDEALASGRDLNPTWPSLSLNANQREGERDETYEILFDAGDGQTYTYHVSKPEEFARYRPGSRWILKVNTFNAVIDTAPIE